MLLKNFSINFKKVAEMRKATCMILGIVLLGTAGCCGESTLERDYGQSWVYNEAIQIANPDAALVQTPVTGLSPNASTTLMNTYNKSFAGQKSDGGSSTTINLGGLTTAGGGGSGGGN